MVYIFIVQKDLLMKKSILAIFSFLLVSGMVARAEVDRVKKGRPTKCAAVEVEKALMSTQRYIQGMDNIKAFAEDKFNGIKAKVEANTKKERELRNKGGNDNKELLALKHEKENIQSENQEIEGQLQQKQQELYMVTMRDLQEAIEIVAKRDGWDKVDPKTFYVAPDFDITHEVVEETDKRYKKEKSASKFKKKEQKQAVAKEAPKGKSLPAAPAA